MFFGSTVVDHETMVNLELVIEKLHQAEIVKQSHMMVCMMVPPMEDYTNDLYVVDSEGLFKHIQGPKGCWVTYKVYPADPEIDKLATEFKATLKELASDIVLL